MRPVTIVLLGFICSSLITVSSGTSECSLKYTYLRVITTIGGGQYNCFYRVQACRGVCSAGIKFDIIVTGSTSKNESHKCSATNDGLNCCESTSITAEATYSPEFDCEQVGGTNEDVGPDITVQIPTACACGECIQNLHSSSQGSLPENTCHRLYWDLP